MAFLAALHAIENGLGRRRTGRWASRVIDLDLLDYGGRIVPDIATYLAWKELSVKQQLKLTPNELVLPHPRIEDRPFVLIPLAEIAPEWNHPVSGASVTELLTRLSSAEKADIVVSPDS